MYLRKLYLVFVAALAALFLSVPVTEGPLKSVALAAGKCGGLNQKACKIWQRPGRPCNKGLVERSSNPLDPNAGRCKKYDPKKPGNLIDQVRDAANAVVAVPADMVTQVPAVIAMSGRDAARLAPLSLDLSSRWARCAVGFKGINRGSGQGFYDAIMGTPCYGETLDAARRHGFKTVTIGIAGGGAAGIGAELETGLAFDVEGVRNATAYESQALKINSYGGSVGLTIGMHMPANDAIGGTGQGIAGGIQAFGGSGGGIWYDYDRNFTGFSVSITAGAGGEAAYVRNTLKLRPTNIRPQRPDAPAPNQQDPHRPAPYEPGPGTPPGDRDFIPDRGTAIGYTPPAPVHYPTELLVCNRSGEPVMYAAIGYSDPRGGRSIHSWTSEGWLQIADGGCRNFILPDDDDGQPYASPVYMMGIAEQTEWDLRDGAFCVSGAAEFTITDANNSACDENDYLLNSHRFAISAGKENTFTFEPGTRVTKETALEVCNKTSRPIIEFAIASDRGPQNGGIVSQGWWAVKRGECHTTKLVDAMTGKAKTGDIFLTARSDVASYGYGGGQLCFNGGTGTPIEHADKAQCPGGPRDVAQIAVRPGPPTRFDFHD